MDPVLSEGYIPFSTACYSIGASLIVFTFLHNIFSHFISPPKHITEPSDSTFDLEYWKWKNLCLSWFHALVCGLWIFSNFIFYTELFEDLILNYSMWSYLMVCFSVGYFTYDFIDMWRQNLLGKLWELTTHHIAITFMMIWNLYDCQRIAWNVIALSAEINSFFLHSRKLLRTHRVDTDTVLYKINMILNFLTFILFRFGTGIVIVVGTCLQYERVSRLYFIGLITMQIVMNGINPVLFWRLLKSDIFKPEKCREITPDKTALTNGVHLKQADFKLEMNGNSNGVTNGYHENGVSRRIITEQQNESTHNQKSL